MRIDPQIAALRGDLTPQRDAQRALEAAVGAWREGIGGRLLYDLACYGEGQALTDCPALHAAVTRLEAAQNSLSPLMEGVVAALAAHPLGQVPLRHQYSDGLAMIQLGQTGRATLTLLAYDPLDQRPETVCFAGGERHELILRGTGDFRLLQLLEERAGVAAIDQNLVRLTEGETIVCEGYAQTRLVERIHGSLVMLRLARTDEVPPQACQYALDDGRLVHRASGSREESQREMAMALLGQMGRSDAAPLLAELAQEGSAHIRWQSLRECLALDTATGFAALSHIAADPGDELSSPAGALKAQLLAIHPQLATLEAAQCPA